MTHTVEKDACEWPCANYTAPLTCLTAPSSETARCDWCRAAAGSLADAEKDAGTDEMGSPYLDRSAVLCRTCLRPLTWETRTEPGYLPRTGWYDDACFGPLVCFKAAGYRHVPLTAREWAYYEAGRNSVTAEPWPVTTRAEKVVACRCGHALHDDPCGDCGCEWDSAFCPRCGWIDCECPPPPAEPAQVRGIPLTPEARARRAQRLRDARPLPPGRGDI